MSWRDVFFSWDFWCAAACCVGAALCLPSSPSNELAKDLFSLGVSVLSIVFAVFFAALTVLVASGDDEFVAFLKEAGVYRGITQTFEFTVGTLFVALLVAVVGFGATAIVAEKGDDSQSWVWLSGFSFLFFYSLFAVVESTRDVIKYSQKRTEFAEAMRQQTLK